MSAIVRNCGGGSSSTIARGIVITSLPTKTSYIEYEELNTAGLAVSVRLSDNTLMDVTSSCTITPSNNSILSRNDTQISVTYTDIDGYEIHTSFSISVKFITGISISTAPTKISYIEGETFDPSGMVIVKNYSDNSYATITGWTTTPNTSTLLTRDNTSVTISYTENGITYTVSQPISVIYVVSISVATPPTKTSYGSGEALDLDGLSLQINYSDNTTAVLSSYTSNPANGATLSSSDTTVLFSTVINGVTYSCAQAISITISGVGFTTASWNDIKNMLSAVDAGIINLSTYWAVGDEKSVVLSSGSINETVTYVIEDLNGQTSGGTNYHAIIGQKNCPISNSMNSSSNTNVGGYNASEMRSYIKYTYEYAIPADMLECIIPSSHISGNGTAGTQTNSNVYFILHAEKEVFGTRRYSVQEEADACTQFEYYKTSVNRIKKRSDSGSANYWWLRSSQHGSFTSFCFVGFDGIINSSQYTDGNSGYNYGVVPFCCI